MDIQAEKLSLIKWITDVYEPSVIKQFIALKKEQEKDWWDEIDNEEKAEIEEGLAQADRGELLSHEEVMAKYQNWRSK
jgi:predicted transcriptional regulator